MAQRLINIGTGPNTKDGDTVRQAFNLSNQNFTELYTLLGQSSNNFTGNLSGSLFTDNSTLVVDGLNGNVYTDNLILSGNTLGVDGSGNLTFNDIVVVSGTSDRLVNGESELVLNVDGSNIPYVTLPNNLTITNSGDVSYIGKTITAGNDALVGRIHIEAGGVRLQGYIDPDGANNTNIGFVQVAPGAVRLQVSEEVAGDEVYSRLDIAPTGMALSSTDGVTTTTFLFDGSALVLPDNGIIQHRQSFTKVTNEIIAAATPSVVWTGTLDSITSVKLNIQVEGNETGDATGWHIQGCEAVIVARWYGSGGVTTPQISVFGVVYTSVAPLVTFTVQRNISTNLIEVIATPTGTANQLEPLYSKIYSVEMNTND